MKKTIKVRLGTSGYYDWGCRLICKCGKTIHFYAADFVGEKKIYTCGDCDRPILVVSDGTPYYVGQAVFPIEQNWGGSKPWRS